jgi:hypothetical protein
MIEITEGEYAAAKGTPSPEDDIDIGERLKQLREEAKDNGGKGTIGEQTSSLSEARQALYSAMGSNIVSALPQGTVGLIIPPGGAPVGSPNYLPGGIGHYFSGSPSASSGTGPTPGPNTISVTNNFAAPPPDPHTWAKGQEFELGALA